MIYSTVPLTPLEDISFRGARAAEDQLSVDVVHTTSELPQIRSRHVSLLGFFSVCMLGGSHNKMDRSIRKLSVRFLNVGRCGFLLGEGRFERFRVKGQCCLFPRSVLGCWSVAQCEKEIVMIWLLVGHISTHTHTHI